MDVGGEFNFQCLPNHIFSSIEKAEVKDSLGKWSMSDGLQLQAYSFDKPFQKYNERDFILDFFGCRNVVSTLMKGTPEHKLIPIGVPAEIVKFSEVKCTMTTLNLFDKLKDGNKIVRSNGSIVKCLPHYVSASGEIDENERAFEVEIADNLRKLILSKPEDADYDDYEYIGDILTEAEKKEFLFTLFSHLVIGGSLCQYEDNIDPYLEVTKLLYKDLIAVARAQEEGGGGDSSDKLKIVSYVYKIHSASNNCTADGKKNLLFHRQYLNNFLYIIVNPLKQLCVTVYHHV